MVTCTLIASSHTVVRRPGAIVAPAGAPGAAWEPARAAAEPRPEVFGIPEPTTSGAAAAAQPGVAPGQWRLWWPMRPPKLHPQGTFG